MIGQPTAPGYRRGRPFPVCGLRVHLARADPRGSGGRRAEGTAEATERGARARHTGTCVHTRTHNLKFQAVGTHTRSSSLNEYNEEYRYHTPHKNCKCFKVALDNVFEIFWNYF